MRKPGWIDRTVIIGFMMASLGLIFIVFGVVSSFDTISFRNKAQTVEGTVTGIEERQESRGRRLRTVAYASVDFEAGDGERHQIEVEKGWGVPINMVGESVNLLYLEEAPNDARVDSFVGIWEHTLYGVGGGALMIGVSAIPIVPAWRRGRR